MELIYSLITCLGMWALVYKWSKQKDRDLAARRSDYPRAKY